MPKFSKTSPLIGAQTYFMQNFMLISDLASILTSEAAFQSTRAISKLRFLWNDAIFLGHCKFSFNDYLHWILVFHLNWWMTFWRDLWCINSPKITQQLLGFDIISSFFPSKIEIEEISTCCRNRQNAENGESSTNSLILFWILTRKHLKKWNKIMCKLAKKELNVW